MCAPPSQIGSINRRQRRRTIRRRNDGDSSTKKVQFNLEQQEEIFEPMSLDDSVHSTSSATEEAVSSFPIDKSALWYSKSDYKEMRRSSSLSKAEEAECVCSSRFLQDEDKKRINEFVNSLLKQQEEQQKMGVSDPKGLFQFSRACSKASRQLAAKKAKEHAEDVAKHYQHTLDILEDVLSILDN